MLRTGLPACATKWRLSFLTSVRARSRTLSCLAFAAVPRRRPHHPAPLQSLRMLLRRFARVGALYFRSERSRHARRQAFLLLVLCLLKTAVSVVFSYMQKGYMTALNEKQVGRFYEYLAAFFGLITVAAPLFAYFAYVQGMLALEWRDWLTRHLLRLYFSDRKYFDLQRGVAGDLDNPDQRICNDVASYVSVTAELAVVLVEKMLSIVAFSGVLVSVDYRLVVLLLAYALLGSWATTRLFGRRLMRLHNTALQRAADLRFALIRVRENAECVAFYRGERVEERHATSLLGLLVGTLREQVLWTRHLTLFTTCYHFATFAVPSLVTAPLYFAGKVEFGTISQVSMAFHVVMDALVLIVDRLGELAAFSAETERIHALLHSLGAVRDDGNAEGRILHAEAPTVSVANLTLRTPNGALTLCEGLNVHLQPGESLLVMGPSGSGKSSLLRALAALWTDGRGTVTTPRHEECLFLPQRPYMPRGTLRDQLLFPACFGGEDGGGASDEDIARALSTVCLADLLPRMGGLDATCDWAAVLSAGEQQRVAVARLLLRRPQPRAAFLDEATSALDPATEATVYGAISHGQYTYVSVGHRASLLKYHTWVLIASGKGQWELHRTERASEAVAAAIGVPQER